MLCVLVFPVNILVSPVSYKFASMGFILQIEERERDREGQREEEDTEGRRR